MNSLSYAHNKHKLSQVILVKKKRKKSPNIGGMSCINCSLSIEKALSKLNGVTHATVNFAAVVAIIEYNLVIVHQKTIENTIANQDNELYMRNRAPDRWYELR